MGEEQVLLPNSSNFYKLKLDLSVLNLANHTQKVHIQYHSIDFRKVYTERSLNWMF